ncbi:cobalamin biosynthesis protein [Thiohalocapsa marina]|uniref:Cobalamin biosynthesis protein n=1 Tax=Thiohalocapsa marina TaxID=424902 RepID=A0A5M8FRC2_9GAMM|nr:cobalamin biosynthesis protein [Thiohalocapsa marina]KAA6186940.1 cobalamin biosynthesis protein [Thiohalocapsa marina]
MNNTTAIALGLGCRRGVSLADLEQAVDAALRPLGQVRVCRLASHCRKADEPALLALARARGWPLQFFPEEALAAVAVPTASARVARVIGTPSVAEAAALLAAGGGELLLPRCVWRGADGKAVTVAAAVMGDGP